MNTMPPLRLNRTDLLSRTLRVPRSFETVPVVEMKLGAPEPSKICWPSRSTRKPPRVGLLVLSGLESWRFLKVSGALCRPRTWPP